MRTCIANVGRGVTKAEFRRNIATIKRKAGPRAVIAFQEIDEADVPNEMDDILWLYRWTHQVIGEQLSVPILVPKRLETFGHKVRIGAEGLAKFTPRRPINRVGIRINDELSVYAFNFHNPISREETQERRDEMVETIREETRAVWELGHSGLWLADTNWRRARDGALPRIAPGEKKVLGGDVGTHAEIDVAKAWVGRGKDLRVVVRNRRTVNLTIDGHNGHIGDVRWVPKAA